MSLAVPNQPRVLLAEDNEATIQAISLLLSTRFRLASAVRDGQAAIKAVVDQEPDVVVLDILMPRLDGLQTTRCLKKLKTRSKIVILTGLEGREYMDAALQAVASGFVFKRRMVTDLVEAVGKVIAGGVFLSPPGLLRVHGS